MLTPPQMLDLLRELDALETAQAVIAARADLTNTFVWQCVATAIRDRRRTLIARAEAQLSADATPPAPAWAADVPPGVVH